MQKIIHYDAADKWDLRFLKLAKEVSEWSKDPSTKTGAVLVAPDRRVIATGYNGFARKVHDTEERLNTREIKYKLVVHCEKNAFIAARGPIEQCALYTWPFMSCSQCAAFMIQTGIARVVAPRNENPRWKDDFVLTRIQFEEAGVDLLEVNGYF